MVQLSRSVFQKFHQDLVKDFQEPIHRIRQVRVPEESLMDEGLVMLTRENLKAQG